VPACERPWRCPLISKVVANSQQHELQYRGAFTLVLHGNKIAKSTLRDLDVFPNPYFVSFICPLTTCTVSMSQLVMQSKASVQLYVGR